MKKILFLAVASMTFACAPKNVFTVNGTVEDTTLNGAIVYLMNDAGKAIDSIVIAEGKFTLKGNIDSVTISTVRLPKQASYVFAEAGTINVAFNADRSVVSGGTPLNDSYNAYTKEIENLSKDFSAKMKSMRESGENEDAMEAAYEAFNDGRGAILDSYFSTNKENGFGVFLLRQKVYQGDYKVSQIDSLMALVPLAKGDVSLEKLRKQKDAYEKTSEGAMFLDFSGKTLEGGDVKFSDYVGKGKYILADFWASWCGPCRRAMPMLKEMHTKYAKDGFEVLGVNVWERGENDNLKAIEEEGMVWAQIVNYKDTTPTDIYGINGIPTLILYAPDGTIITRSHNPEDIKVKLEEILKK